MIFSCFKHLNLAIFFCSFILLGQSQSYRWQQSVKYEMNIDFDDAKHQFDGSQKLLLRNNSPDTLTTLYYHLYFNAFQPGSDMDVRFSNLPDPDPRVANRIGKLQESEIGFQEIKSLKQDNKSVDWTIIGSILKVELHHPIFPFDSSEMTMKFFAQVPVQIRRSGRMNKEGIDYSMSQWYPQLCNYDEHGWHANQYLGGEFYAPWGDFLVRIRMNKKYTIAATGYALSSSDPQYVKSTLKNNSPDTIWQFYAPKVHDFVWAADPDYVHDTVQISNNRVLHFYHQPNEKFDEAWKSFPSIMREALKFIEMKFGPYPYKSYSFIQGGDGGMEYPMATLITGNRPLISLVGVGVHELMHTWFQMLLASNEAFYPWMDEGFTSYAQQEVMNYLFSLNLIPGSVKVEDSHLVTVKNYIKFVTEEVEETLSTHADFFQTTKAYQFAAYSKGAMCLHQLRYIIGDRLFEQGMLDYYYAWRFKHPNPDDFFRVMEKTSGLELDWFKDYYVNSTYKMDVAVDSVITNKEGKSMIVLSRLEPFPMPIDLIVTLKNGKMLHFNIPLDLMLGHKELDKGVKLLEPWHWVSSKYTFTVNESLEDILSVQIDPKQKMLDIDISNNKWMPGK